MGCGTSRNQDIKEPLVERECGDIKTYNDIKIANLSFMDESQKQITDIYEIGGIIYYNKFDFVKKIVQKFTKETRVVKVVNKKFIETDKNRYHIANEIMLLSKLNHPNIVNAFEYYKDNVNYYFVYEYVDSGTLIDQLLEVNNFSEKIVKTIIKQVLECLAYIHNNKYVHRDLSLRNILVDSLSQDNFQIKIIDWGNALKLNQPMIKTKDILGDLHFRAPEVISGNYGYQSDIWSVGIMLYTLIEGEMPFHQKKEEDTTKDILNEAPNYTSQNWVEISTQCQDFISKILKKDYKLRPSAKDLLNHEWFKAAQQSTESILSKSKHMENLIKFQAHNLLQTAALTYLSTQVMSKYEKEEAAQEIDTEHSGTITKEELTKVSQLKFGQTLNSSQIEEIFESLDSNKSGRIDYNEFLALICEKKKLKSEDCIKKAFQFFDKDSNGFITIEELKQSLGYSLKQKNEQAWKDLMNQYDLNGDNKISYEEFKIVISNFSE